MKWLLSFLIFCSLQVYGDATLPPQFEPPIPAGALISVEGFDPASETYRVLNTSEPEIGPNRAMPGDLVSAIATLNAKELASRPQSVVGNTYKLDKELRLLTDRGVSERTKLLKRKK